MSHSTMATLAATGAILFAVVRHVERRNIPTPIAPVPVGTPLGMLDDGQGDMYLPRKRTPLTVIPVNPKRASYTDWPKPHPHRDLSSPLIGTYTTSGYKSPLHL